MAICITFGTHGELQFWLKQLQTSEWDLSSGLVSGVYPGGTQSTPSILHQTDTRTEFTSMLEGYENVRAYCYNCQHWNGHCLTRWPFFTVCFVPLIPLAMHKYKEVTCYTCRFTQDLRDRPDITPDTRPPPNMQWGPQPPPGAQWQQPQPQPPPQAHGAQQLPDGYK
ncbi:uncharacterized protein N7482_008162 [Penicillium canariense]|uniref:Rhodopsin family protein n=1 Tax=Penicillium canariense TaxID=189055 RepID=A0A9W9LIH7_9EURO|nr:uncharacterized protein N7482_008162 [Penicillium canariense]KAJ5157062.1 hypothetical protein N7482_008162 [Penicillium canariense]